MANIEVSQAEKQRQNEVVAASLGALEKLRKERDASHQDDFGSNQVLRAKMRQLKQIEKDKAANPLKHVRLGEGDRMRIEKAAAVQKQLKAREAARQSQKRILKQSIFGGSDAYKSNQNRPRK